MHTPGPLFVDGDSESVMHFHVRQGKEAGFHQVAMYCSEADAHLYASAPDLLEACKAAATLINIARLYFPKSIKNCNKFSLEKTNATLNNVIQEAESE